MLCKHAHLYYLRALSEASTLKLSCNYYYNLGSVCLKLYCWHACTHTDHVDGPKMPAMFCVILECFGQKYEFGSENTEFFVFFYVFFPFFRVFLFAGACSRVICRKEMSRTPLRRYTLVFPVTFETVFCTPKGQGSALSRQQQRIIMCR